MIKVSDNINVFKNSLAQSAGFFTGGINEETLPFDPLVTGYAIIKWISLPKWVEDTVPGFREMTEKNFKSFDGISDFELQTTTYQHNFNANEYNFATSITKNNTEFTLKHQEFSGNPIKNGYQVWVTGIRDPRTDVATYPKLYNTDYAAKNHTGKLMYIMLRPDVDNIDKTNIEFAAYYTNVLPTKVPLSHLNYSQGSHDAVEIDMNFKATIHVGPVIDDWAREILKSSYGFVYEGEYDPKSFQSGGVAESISANHNIDSSPIPGHETEQAGMWNI